MYGLVGGSFLVASRWHSSLSVAVMPSEATLKLECHKRAYKHLQLVVVSGFCFHLDATNEQADKRMQTPRGSRAKWSLRVTVGA